jgi:ATP-dependent Zn protease
MEILQALYSEAQSIVRQHQDQLEIVTRELLRLETLEAEAFEALVAR